ncbi:2Fe-2S iron-sulfur cluster-binding protein [Streptomyces abyssalis]|uniref:2Fe-2S iron-sulfur cluster-binding protein n=1 Tax=Streptomyces abyssalis TaxID=933944 RepID=UPI00099FB964|nr:(2Fe-2S)-binding protein [Streptomyces abyssalis]
MSNGSPHDPNAPGEGYGHGQGHHGQGYTDGYGSEYGEYAEYGDEGGYRAEYGEYGEYGGYGQRAQHAQQQPGRPQPHPSYPQDGSYPREGWGGESDQDATAFVQLPAGPLPPPGAGVEAWGPLAAPGTGQGGYTPPPLDPAEVAGQQGSGQPVAPAADGPESAGQWAMPFGEGTGAGGPGGYDPSSHGQQYEQQFAPQQDQQPGTAGAFGDQGGAGQGAAAALAGSHEARTQRRPLGTGGGITPDEAEPIGPGTQFSGPAAPQHGSAGSVQHQQDIAGDEHFAEAHARRQVPFEGHLDGREAVPGTVPGEAAETAPGDAGGTYASASQSAQWSEAAPSGGTAADTATDGGTDDADGTGARAPMGTVRSGLPFTPSSGTGIVTDTAGTDVAGTDAGPDARTDAGPNSPAPGGGWAQPPAPAAPEPAPAPEPEAPPGPAQASGSTRVPAPSTAREAGAGEPATDDEVSEERPVELAPELGGEHPHVSYVLHVNGIDRPVTDAWIGESLLYVLRERLGLAGAKDGCSQGECGACSVQVDGRLVAACLVPAATAAGSEIRTVEGLASDGVPSDVQRALTESGAVQCGFCVPGLAMTVHDLLEGNHAPSELEARKAISGNLCRCSGYRGVLDAVRTVVSERAEQAAREEAEAEAEAEAYEQELADASARIPHQAGPGAGGAHFPGGGGA